MSGEATSGAIKNIENHEAFNIIDELKNANKIDADGYV